MHKEIPQALMNSSSKMYKRQIIYLLYLLILHSFTNSRENILLYHFYWDAAILKELKLSLMFYLVVQTPKQTRTLIRKFSFEFAML